MPTSTRNHRPLTRLSQPALLLVLCALLSSCQSAKVSMEPPDPGLIDGLISKGNAAAAHGHWDQPQQNSALDYYQRALLLDPASLAARRGLEQLVERYLQKARWAAEAQQHVQAQSLMAHAQKVDPAHPGVAPTQQYLALLRDSQRQALTIDRVKLARRDAQLANALTSLGEQARSAACRVIVTTGNDTDYRWIYQRMAAAPGTNRIRAQFNVGAPSRVTLLCQP